MTKEKIIGLVLFAVLLVGIGFLAFNATQDPNKNNLPLVTNFEECAQYYPIMESYPRRCQAPGSIVFVETASLTGEELEVPSDPKPVSPPITTGKCYVGGCSSQICSDQEGMASTCEYREEYACYQNAKCERQASGHCGWTQTLELQACITNAK